jgi:4-hydroxybenzoyl-CoA thioesterase
MAFRAPIKVCFSDIDNAGIVYYPRFMHYFHLAMEEFFASVVGIDYSDVLHKRNLSFPTVRVEADFKRRMKYGDQIDMEVRILKIGRSSIHWGYQGYLHQDEKILVVEGNNVTVCVRTNTFEKIEVPSWLRKTLTDYMKAIE